MKRYFVTGIDTDSGKTVTAAILCEALHADYWKPIQAGRPSDRETVMNWVTNRETAFHEEAFFLSQPMSPHAAAKLDGVEISLDLIRPPVTPRDLVVEGAGGCLVPLNDREFVIDIALLIDAEVILVADLYLGSINHTLLTTRLLQQKQVKVKGIVFNGEPNEESQRIILQHSALPQLLHIRQEPVVSREVIARYAKQLKETWQ